MNTKEKLFNSMYDLIAEVGYEKASINQICLNAGINKSSFYYFYNSKESLFKELIEFGYQDNSDIDVNKILSTTSKENYKKTLLNIGNNIINNFEVDLKWKKVIAEIELQATRSKEINLLVDTYNNEIRKNLKQILNHGIKIEAFNKNFDLELNANILYVIIQGLDYVLLAGIKLNGIDVYNYLIEEMFK